MIQEVYHTNFGEDVLRLSKILSKSEFYECLLQIDNAIKQVLENPQKHAVLKYAPLLEYRKKKFFSFKNPKPKQRPNMRLLYQYNQEENKIYFLSVGLRIVTKPKNQNDVYQQTKKRNLRKWG